MHIHIGLFSRIEENTHDQGNARATFLREDYVAGTTVVQLRDVGRRCDIGKVR